MSNLATRAPCGTDDNVFRSSQLGKTKQKEIRHHFEPSRTTLAGFPAPGQGHLWYFLLSHWESFFLFHLHWRWRIAGGGIRIENGSSPVPDVVRALLYEWLHWLLFRCMTLFFLSCLVFSASRRLIPATSDSPYLKSIRDNIQGVFFHWASPKMLEYPTGPPKKS